MRLRNAWVGFLGMTLAATVVACGGGEPSNKSADASSPSATPAGQRVDTATAGTVKGVVMIDPERVPRNENPPPVIVAPQIGGDWDHHRHRRPHKLPH